MSDASTYLAAFLCGGILCLIGQILIDKTKLTPARILVLYVVVGVILGRHRTVRTSGRALQVQVATVPLTGFGYNPGPRGVQGSRRKRFPGDLIGRRDRCRRGDHRCCLLRLPCRCPL